MSAPAIQVEGIGKRYRIRKASTRDARGPFSHLLRMLRPASDDETLWAVRDVSFSVAEGEVVAVLGTNGAGKSTLLKLLSRVTPPTLGQARIRGRLGCLLEIGTGFHPDLTGRENLQLNTAILGMSPRALRSRFDRIVEFSEVGDFLDTPVKHYSSGMRMRLAFSAAAHLDVPVLILDEVLSVGDVAFRQKCMRRIGELMQEGRTILLVTHDVSKLVDLAPRALWMVDGRLAMDAETSLVLGAYLAATGLTGDGFLLPSSPDGSLRVRAVRTITPQGCPADRFEPGDSVRIEIDFVASRRIESPFVLVSIGSLGGPLFVASNFLDGCRPAALEGEGTIALTFHRPPLMPLQTYVVRMAAYEGDKFGTLLPKSDLRTFEVGGIPAQLGWLAPTAEGRIRGAPPIRCAYRWELPDGSAHEFRASPC